MSLHNSQPANHVFDQIELRVIIPDNYEYQPLPVYVINQMMAIDYKYFSRIRIFVDFVVSEALAKIISFKIS